MASGDSVLTSSFMFDAIGTSWEINTPAPLTAVTRAHVLDLMERFDSIYSRFLYDSIVTRIAKAPQGGTFSFPADARPMFDLYDRLYDATDGAVDPLVGRDLELLGYDSDYALVPVYTATGEYGGQPSHITVKATLKDGVITAVTVTPHAYVPRSLELQRAFAAAVPKVVIGKRIDQVRVGKLAGSSGTPKGFNDAIRQIRAQAAGR